MNVEKNIDYSDYGTNVKSNGENVEKELFLFYVLQVISIEVEDIIVPGTGTFLEQNKKVGIDIFNWGTKGSSIDENSNPSTKILFVKRVANKKRVIMNDGAQVIGSIPAKKVLV